MGQESMRQESMRPATLEERPGEECGVFGVYAPGADVARLTYFGLYALQHRGQESAGIATSDGASITLFKDLGLVNQVFNEWALASLQGHIAIGHTRYSTTGSTLWENAQPAYRNPNGVEFALGHNGNLTNTTELAAKFGHELALTDTDLMADAMVSLLNGQASEDVGVAGTEPSDAFIDAVTAALPLFEGAYTLVMMDRDRLIGVRDRHGFRPLCIGKLDGGWVLASETAALDVIAAQFVREVDPGEMVIIDGSGLRSVRPLGASDPKLCLLEFVYFSRPDSVLSGTAVHLARRKMGEALAHQSPVKADIVVPVPESGVPAAQGFAMASGIPYIDGLVKNGYVGRTFIQPAQVMRDQGIRMKLNPIPGAFDGRKAVIVDDSIIRGTTTRLLVDMVRAAGAEEVHLRISSPPYRWPCFYGMDTPDREHLLAAGRTEEEVADVLRVDSLAYLSLDRLLEATGAEPSGFCTACISGEYPTPIPINTDKLRLERAQG